MQTVETVDIDLLRNSVAFTLTMRKFSNRRSGDMAHINVEADKSRLKLTKQLIVSPELDRISEFQAELYKWVTMRSVPSFFKEGLYLVKLNMIEAFEAKLAGAVEELDNALVGNLIAAYPAQIDAARVALNGQFQQDDYPSCSEMRKRFGISWNWLAFGVPETLPAELRAAEEAKIKESFLQAEIEIRAALREGFAEIISHVTDRLTVKPGEKAKIFRNSLFENLTEFIGTFAARNLVDDGELAAQVAKAQEILAQVRGDKPADQATLVRDSEELRRRTSEAFAGLKSEVEKIIISRPSRQFDLEA